MPPKRPMPKWEQRVRSAFKKYGQGERFQKIAYVQVQRDSIQGLRLGKKPNRRALTIAMKNYWLHRASRGTIPAWVARLLVAQGIDNWTLIPSEFTDTIPNPFPKFHNVLIRLRRQDPNRMVELTPAMIGLLKVLTLKSLETVLKKKANTYETRQLNARKKIQPLLDWKPANN